MCISIANITDQYTSTSGQDEDGTTSTLRLSNSAFSSNNSDEGTLFNISSTPLGFNATTTFTDITSPIVDVSIIYMNQTSYPGFYTLEAVFSYYVYTLKANIKNGQPSISKKGVYSNFFNNTIDTSSSGEFELFTRLSGDLIYMVDSTTRATLATLASSLVIRLNGSILTTGDSEYYSSDSA